MPLSRWILVFGLQAGSLWWLLSGLALGIPLYCELALPYRDAPEMRSTFWFRCLLVLFCASIPGGSLLGAALIVRQRRLVPARS